MSPIVTVIIAAVCLAAGCAGGFALFRYILTGKYKDTMEKAEKAAEVLKEKKLLEVKEKRTGKGGPTTHAQDTARRKQTEAA